MVTIKELSDSIGVSKVAVNKWIEKNGYKDHLQKHGNKYMIPADVEQAVRSYFDRREQKPTKSINPASDSENTVTSEIIALLREQLEAKDREIDRLHSQVETLQAMQADFVKAVREINTLQAMQITDGTDREQVERTKSEQRENDTLTNEEPERRTHGEHTATPDERPKKRSFWDRIKGR